MTQASDGPVPTSPTRTSSGSRGSRVATVGPHGEPQSSPVWYDWDGSRLLFSQTTGRQKYKNLQRDDAIALSITDPENPYRYIEIRGHVTVEDDPGGAFINKMAKKYLNEDVYPWPQPGDVRVVVKVQPEHATTQG